MKNSKGEEIGEAYEDTRMVAKIKVQNKCKFVNILNKNGKTFKA